MREGIDVVLASNRAPMSFVRGGDGYDIKRGAGGLAGALDPVARRLGEHARWIATATSEVDRAAIRAGATTDLEVQLGYRVDLLDIDPEVYRDYYDEVSNRMLWFANHCLFDEIGIPRFDDDALVPWDDAYQAVNRRFSEALERVSGDDTLVLFQDYHLMTAPALLRRARPTLPMLHFTHSSFCGPEGLSHLPERIRAEAIEGMLGADLAGFHVHQWVDGFLRACEELGYEVDRADARVERDGRSTWARAYPITIDAARLRRRAAREEARDWARRFRSDRNVTLVVRADRTEPSKNIVRGFEAFEVLLDRREDLRGNVRFIACLYPSRQNMDEYQAYMAEVEEMVGRINALYPDHVDLYMQDDFDRTLGALLVYDVLVVNPLMDGMNLVAKEGPAINERDGVLVLSSKAGAYEDLGSIALGIEDPLDIRETAAAIEAAIDLAPDARSKHAAALRTTVEARKPEDWIEAQIEDLLLIREGSPPATSPW